MTRRHRLRCRACRRPVPRAGAPHVEGSNSGEAESPANRWFDRGFDRSARQFVLTAFGSGSSTPTQTRPAPANRFLPAGQPRPQVVALRGSLRLQLPIAQDRVTAIGYHAVGGGALSLEPVGRQANAGLLTRIARRLFGSGERGLSYYVLGGQEGPSTAALDVGARRGRTSTRPSTGRSSA